MLSLNLNAKPYIPKHLQESKKDPPQETKPKTKLNIAQMYIPKSRQFQLSNVPKKEKKVYKEYFVIEEDDANKQYTFDLDYMLSFENWEISKETKLLSKEYLDHLEEFKTVETEEIKWGNSQNPKNKKKYPDNNSNTTNLSLGDFTRKDTSKEKSMAEEFKKKFDMEALKDPITNEITDCLNKLTVDNYANVEKDIYKVIEDSPENQQKFLDVVFTKAVKEKSFAKLYSKLCKSFDTKLKDKIVDKDEKKDSKDAKKKTSDLRKKLLDKCREIFKTDNNDAFDQYIKVQDPVEKAQKIKQFLLGNVNFIGELINTRLLSKKIVSQCIGNLFTRFNDSKGDKSIKMINLEAIVILLNNFGTLLKEKEDKMKTEEKVTYNQQVKEYLERLDEIKDKGIDEPVKYKIINLIERSKNNWEKSQFEQSLEAKGKKDFEEEKTTKGDSSLKKYSQNEVTDEISKDLVNFKIYMEEEGGSEKNYDWRAVESIYYEHGNSMAEILQGFLDSCIDFVVNKKTLNLSRIYFNEIIFYYENKMKNNEKNELVTRTNHLLKVARDASLDNPLFIDVWAKTLGTLIRAKIYIREDLLGLSDLTGDDLKTIFVIIGKIIKDDPNGRIHYENCKFVQRHKKLYDEEMNQNSE